jgi:hypothetical protein
LPDRRSRARSDAARAPDSRFSSWKRPQSLTYRNILRPTNNRDNCIDPHIPQGR